MSQESETLHFQGMKVPTLAPSVNPMCPFTCVLYNEVVNRKVSLSSVYTSQNQHEEEMKYEVK